jgi:hypothetical protein
MKKGNNMQQRMLDFDQPAAKEPEKVAEDTSLPPPVHMDTEFACRTEEATSRSSNGHHAAAPEPMIQRYTLVDFRKFYGTLMDGTLTFEQYRENFERLVAGKAALVEDLLGCFNATQLKGLALRFDVWTAKQNNKPLNAALIYERMVGAFCLEHMYSRSWGESIEDAIRKKVEAVTPESFAEYQRQRQAKKEQEQQALSNPQTLDDFRTFLDQKSEDDLADEQLVRYDCLIADAIRERRAAERPTTVDQFESEELNEQSFRIKEGYHDKRQCPLWIVQLVERVDRGTFAELKTKAKMLGGWYSSFKRDDAGFQFLEQTQAERFAGLLTGAADRADVLEARQASKEETAAERLLRLADELAARAKETVERSKNSLQNTARRASIQAGVRSQAYSDQALAKTIRSIGDALGRGEGGYLDGIRHKTQIEELQSLLQQAKWERTRKEQIDNGSHIDAEKISARAPEAADVRYAEYPYPRLWAQNLTDAVRACKSAPGAKLAAARMEKRIRRAGDYVTFREEYEIKQLQDFVSRAKAAGHDTDWLDRQIEPYKRLQRAGITDVHQLRCALRDLLTHWGQKQSDDPVAVAERELIGKKLAGFFPTPRPIIDRMLRLACIEPHHTILEPSCGKGDILDALADACPDNAIAAIELDRSLTDVLRAKGHDYVAFGDFLAHRGQYDRIVMNPPFENGADIDHVRHAYNLLSPQGRLVSVMSEGPFFRSDRKAVAFREWLNERGGETYELPADAFNTRDAFRQTGVKTRLVVIDKA